jgi:hypothetical protein
VKDLGRGLKNPAMRWPDPSPAAQDDIVSAREDFAESVSALLREAGLGRGVEAIGVRVKGSGRVEGHAVDVRDELEVRVPRLVPGNELAGVGGHASHQGDDVGLAGAARLIVRLILVSRSNRY